MGDLATFSVDGREFTNDELIKFYRDNLRSGNIPVAGYFCPLCHNEVSYNKGYVCTHCNINDDEEEKNDN